MHAENILRDDYMMLFLQKSANKKIVLRKYKYHPTQNSMLARTFENGSQELTQEKGYSANFVKMKTHNGDAQPFEFSKKDYLEVLSEKRAQFMFENFKDDLKEAFQELRGRSERMVPCEHTVSFTLKDHFDAEKVQAIIVAYFTDLGYTVTPIKVLIPMEVCVVLT